MSSREKADLDQDLIRELEERERHDDAGYLAALNRALARVTIRDNGEPLLLLTTDTVGGRIFVNLVGLGVPADEYLGTSLRYP